MKRTAVQGIVSMSVLSFLVFLAGPSPVLAGGSRDEIATKISFEFSVGDRSFPAGSYRISRRSPNAPTLTIRPEAGGEAVQVSVITRLAQRGNSADDSNLVFDKVGDKRYLTEVWMPGQDGFLLKGATETAEHAHVIVPAK